ncbi:hypothetical protein F5Y18DRAFT_444931 [Xylariaceae sp. FL1019]|nr:hypothetical protein F5Y18DRAFT_444931 [Xylariaceae sp. FL1019]
MHGNKSAKFYQKGFAFSRGIVRFSRHDDENGRIHLALHGGSGGDSDEEISVRVATLLIALFEICLEYKEVAVASRLGHSYWFAVNQKWKPHVKVTDNQIQAIIDVYTDARTATIGNRRYDNTKLANLVDSFLAMRQEIHAMPPLAQLTLLYRPAQGENAMDVDSSIIPQAVAPENSWPPSYLNDKEVLWVTDPRIVEELSGWSYRHQPNPEAMLAIPSGFAHPVDIAKYLSITALYNQDSAKKHLSIYMRPIAFLNERQKKDWWYPTGTLSKLYDTVGDFIAYAHDKLNDDYHTVAGFFTYWPSTNPRDYFTFDPTIYSDRGERWHKTCPKYGIVVFVGRDALWDIRMIIYDSKHSTLKTDEGHSPPEWQFKREICNAINGSLNPFSHYHGGPHATRKGDDGVSDDVVGNALSYLWEVANGHSGGDKLDNIWDGDFDHEKHESAFDYIIGRSFVRYLNGDDKVLDGVEELEEEEEVFDP